MPGKEKKEAIKKSKRLHIMKKFWYLLNRYKRYMKGEIYLHGELGWIHGLLYATNTYNETFGQKLMCIWEKARDKIEEKFPREFLDFYEK